MPLTLKETKDVADVIHATLTSAAIVVGGIAAYWKWFRGRTFRPRLEVTIEATFSEGDAGGLATITCTARNLGLVGVPLDQQGSGLILQAPLELEPTEGLSRLHWHDSPVDAVDVFTNHSWIEPGEPIVDRHAYVILGNHPTVYRCEVVVARKPFHRWRKSRVSWRQHTFLNTRPQLPPEDIAS